MIIGEMLATGATATSPWFARLGNAATFFCEVIAQTTAFGGVGSSATAQVTITVQTKNAQELDSAASDLGSTTTTGTGVRPLRATGLEELVRFVYVVAYAPVLVPPPEATGFIQFRMLPPAWEDNCVNAASA